MKIDVIPSPRTQEVYPCNPILTDPIERLCEKLWLVILFIVYQVDILYIINYIPNALKFANSFS